MTAILHSCSQSSPKHLIAIRSFGSPALICAVPCWLPCVLQRLTEEGSSPWGACSKLLVLDPAAMPDPLHCGLSARSGDGSTVVAASCRAEETIKASPRWWCKESNLGTF